MTERPYRSGAQQACLICRQSEEIRETVKKMGIDETYGDIIKWLKTKGINASIGQVSFFLKKSNVPSRIITISPNGDYKSRMTTYITQLLSHTRDTFTIHNLGLKGPRWSAVTVRLHHRGLIEPIEPHRGYTPLRWKIVSTKDEILAWRDSELERITKEAHRSHR